MDNLDPVTIGVTIVGIYCVSLLIALVLHSALYNTQITYLNKELDEVKQENKRLLQENLHDNRSKVIRYKR